MIEKARNLTIQQACFACFIVGLLIYTSVIWSIGGVAGIVIGYTIPIGAVLIGIGISGHG